MAGIGWMHYYVGRNMGEDQNGMSTKLGLNFNFNLGENKAWTLALKPALVYDMNSMGTKPVYFHSGRAVWEISAGFVYHFRCSNGEHHFTKVADFCCTGKTDDRLSSGIQPSEIGRAHV